MAPRYRAMWVVLFVGYLAPFSMQAQVSPHLSAEAFGQLPLISDPSLSPDGKHLAVIQSFNGRPAAVIYDLATSGAKPTALPYADGFVVGVQWKNNNRALITVNLNQRPDWHAHPDVIANFRIIAVDADGQNAVVLVREQERGWWTSTANIADLAPDDENHVDILLGNDVLKVDVTTGATSGVYRGAATVAWVMDGHGHPVARVDRKRLERSDHLKIWDGNEPNQSWKEIRVFDVSPGTEVGIVGLSADGSAVVRRTSDDNGMRGLTRISLADGTETKLFFNPKFDVQMPLLDPWTGRVIGVSFIDDMARYQYFDTATEKMQQALEAAFPGKSVHAMTWDIARTKLVLAVDAPSRPRAYYLFDRGAERLASLGKTYPGLKDAKLGDVKPYPYQARDGLEIPAYLTLPPNKAPRDLPTVIMPHGGPMARDAMDFDWTAQFLVSRGYAVLQPNFRGSDGYGKKFEEEGYGEWGRKMQNDLTDGVMKLIADGISDPKRICIFGGSYGGYAALAGATLTPDLYSCAASWAGVSDLKEFLDTREKEYGKYSSMIESWEHFIGDAWSDSSKLKASSPARLADRVNCPILLMHGTDDTTVRINQSELMRDALQRAGKKFTYVPFEGETHYMETATTRTRVLKELEAFLMENIGN